MQPTIHLHGVASVVLEPIAYFAENPPVKAFACRELTVTSRDGSYSLSIFGPDRASLLTDSEIEVARLQEEVEALRYELAEWREAKRVASQGERLAVALTAADMAEAADAAGRG